MLIPLVKIHGFIIGMGGLALGLSFIVYTRIEKGIIKAKRWFKKVLELDPTNKYATDMLRAIEEENK